MLGWNITCLAPLFLNKWTTLLFSNLLGLCLWLKGMQGSLSWSQQFFPSMPLSWDKFNQALGTYRFKWFTQQSFLMLICPRTSKYAFLISLLSMSFPLENTNANYIFRNMCISTWGWWLQASLAARGTQRRPREADPVWRHQRKSRVFFSKSFQICEYSDS